MPLKPEGYKVTVPFNEASQLAIGSDVRISGVSVGRVSRVEGGPDGEAEATIELDARYAPIPSDTQAILRQKTLLGETYVELTPGLGGVGEHARGRRPARGAGLRGGPARRGLPHLRPGARRRPSAPGCRARPPRSAAGARTCRSRSRASSRSRTRPSAPSACSTRRAWRSASSCAQGGEVFGALSERRGQLRGLIENANIVFGTTAQRNEELAEAFTIFPTFLRESRDDAHAPRGVRGRHRPGRHRPAPDGSRARADRAGAGRALARSWSRSSARSRRRSTPRRPACARRAASWTTTCRRCSGGLDDWLAPGERASSRSSAVTAAR